MKIPAEHLSEKNYEGTRLIQINSSAVKTLKKQLDELQKKANPTLKVMEELSKKLDPYYSKIGEHQKAIDDIKKEMKDVKDLYDIEIKKVELIDQKAQLVKNKIQPLVLAQVEGKLGEFEKANQMIEKNGVIFVEVIDEIEEKIKQVRANKK